LITWWQHSKVENHCCKALQPCPKTYTIDGKGKIYTVSIERLCLALTVRRLPIQKREVTKSQVFPK